VHLSFKNELIIAPANKNYYICNMQFLYNIAIGLADLFLPIIALFSSKMKRSHLGRKETFSKLKQNISSSDSVIWIHCASLGEFEQGRPIIEHLAIEYPNDKIVLSFFSPSGYEVRKDYDKVAAVVYLPLDTKKKTSHFLEILKPRSILKRLLLKMVE